MTSVTPHSWRVHHVDEGTDVRRSRRSPRARELPGWYYEDGWIRRVLQDRRLADDADARQRHRLRRRGGLPSSGLVGDVGARRASSSSTHSAGGITDKDFALARASRKQSLVASGRGRRADGHAEQVRAERRSARDASAGGAAPRVLFVTGRLAEPALRRVLADMAPPFAYDVAVLGITVAALMTTTWIARILDDVPDGTDLVAHSRGSARATPTSFANAVGVRVEKGPKDLREIPQHFGRAPAAREYGAWDIEIVAEINNAPRLTRDETAPRRRVLPRRRARTSSTSAARLAWRFPTLGDVVARARRRRHARERRHLRLRTRSAPPSLPARSSC